MVRAPCCEKMGLKRGPWTSEEDKILIAFIQNYGHGNWRALPKQAGLLRCGKSCRLRWTNYLRPDIKRGNFSIEEEENIIKLHELLGNRWSAIAARLPGRTDNEIKNVWHTHLKKRLNKNDTTRETKRKSVKKGSKGVVISVSESEPENCRAPSVIEVSNTSSESPQQSSSEFSSGTDSSSVVSTVDNRDMGAKDEYNKSAGTNVSFDSTIDIGETFWTDESLYENLNMLEDFPASTGIDAEGRTSFSSDSSIVDDGMDFWFDLFMKAEEEPILTEL